MLALKNKPNLFTCLTAELVQKVLGHKVIELAGLKLGFH